MTKKKVTNTDTLPLTEQETWDVISFAKQMSGAYNNIYTPDLVNARMRDMNLNPIAGTQDIIDKALLNPKENEKELRGLSEYFEMIDMLYKRQIQFLGNLLSWDLTYTCTNAEIKDYNTPAYKKDEKILESFLQKFNYKKEFKSILRQLIRRETMFCVFREDGDQYLLQELNIDYCKITGRWDYGFLWDFDYTYFLSNPGVDIQMYPKSMQKQYIGMLKNTSNKYIPHNPIDKRNSSYIYWKQTSPVDGFWCFKFNPELATNVPFFAPLFSELVIRPMIRKLQTSKYIIEASKVLIGLIGFNKDTKSGSVKDALQLSPETAGKFASLVRQGLAKEINFAIAPFEDIKSFEFSGSATNILDQYNKVAVASSGNNSRLLYTTDRTNAEESRNSLSIDEQVVTFMYPYFEDFMNYFINKKTKKYKFQIHFEGTQMPASRKERLDNANALAQLGMVLPQSFAAALGKNPFDFERELAMAKAKGFVDGLTPIVMASQMSGKDNENGRPTSEKSGKEISDSAEITRQNGSNIEKGTGKI